MYVCTLSLSLSVSFVRSFPDIISGAKSYQYKLAVKKGSKESVVKRKINLGCVSSLTVLATVRPYIQGQRERESNERKWEKLERRKNSL